MMVRCPRCGEPVECRPGRDCWCEKLPARLPATDASLCLCPSCLAAAIAAAAESTTRHK